MLKDEGVKVGVSATFTKAISGKTLSIKVAYIVKIKGAIIAVNRYDADLYLYEHAILVQSDIVE